jgi:hypothetical protein
LLKLVKKVILKKGVELPENLDDFLNFVVLIIVKHGALAGFKPLFIDPKCGGNQADDPFVDLFIPQLNACDIAFGYADPFGKGGLGHVKRMTKLYNPFIGAHVLSL